MSYTSRHETANTYILNYSGRKHDLKEIDTLSGFLRQIKSPKKDTLGEKLSWKNKLIHRFVDTNDKLKFSLSLSIE